MNRALLLALLATGCAGHAPPRFGDGPPPGDRHGPDGGAARLFVSPEGEPFRTTRDGDPERAWFDAADADHDGRLTVTEMRADALRFFATLDIDHDGEIDPAEIDRYETAILPELRVAGTGGRMGATRGGGPRQGGRGGRGPGGGRPGGGEPGGGGPAGDGPGGQAGRTSRTPAVRQGAARYSYLDLPEPVTAADRNLNRGVNSEEMARAAAERFAQLDTAHRGYLAWNDLPHVDTHADHRGPPPHERRMPDTDAAPPRGDD